MSKLCYKNSNGEVKEYELQDSKSSSPSLAAMVGSTVKYLPLAEGSLSGELTVRFSDKNYQPALGGPVNIYLNMTPTTITEFCRYKETSSSNPRDTYFKFGWDTFTMDNGSQLQFPDLEESKNGVDGWTHVPYYAPESNAACIIGARKCMDLGSAVLVEVLIVVPVLSFGKYLDPVFSYTDMNSSDSYSGKYKYSVYFNKDEYRNLASYIASVCGEQYSSTENFSLSVTGGTVYLNDTLYANMGIFGGDDLLYYNNKFYRMKFRTSRSAQTPNIPLYDADAHFETETSNTNSYRSTRYRAGIEPGAGSLGTPHSEDSTYPSNSDYSSDHLGGLIFSTNSSDPPYETSTDGSQSFYRAVVVWKERSLLLYRNIEGPAAIGRTDYQALKNIPFGKNVPLYGLCCDTTIMSLGKNNIRNHYFASGEITAPKNSVCKFPKLLVSTDFYSDYTEVMDYHPGHAYLLGRDEPVAVESNQYGTVHTISAMYFIPVTSATGLDIGHPYNASGEDRVKSSYFFCLYELLAQGVKMFEMSGYPMNDDNCSITVTMTGFITNPEISRYYGKYYKFAYRTDDTSHSDNYMKKSTIYGDSAQGFVNVDRGDVANLAAYGRGITASFPDGAEIYGTTTDNKQCFYYCAPLVIEVTFRRGLRY